MSHLRRTSHLVSMPTYAPTEPTGLLKPPRDFLIWAAGDSKAFKFREDEFHTVHEIWALAQAMYVRLALRLKTDTDDSVCGRFHRISSTAQRNWARSAMTEYQRNIELGLTTRRTSWSDAR